MSMVDAFVANRGRGSITSVANHGLVPTRSGDSGPPESRIAVAVPVPSSCPRVFTNAPPLALVMVSSDMIVTSRLELVASEC